MATDISTNYTGNFDVAQTAPRGSKQFARSRYFDCSTATGTNLTNTEYKILKVSAGQIITDVILYVVTGETATLSVGIDSGAADAIATDMQLASAAVVNTNATATALTKVAATTDDWLTITPSATLDSAKFYIVVYITEVNATNDAATAV